MSVTIRLSRIGKKNQPSYQILVCETRSKRNSKYIERLGSFNPSINPPSLNVDQQKIDSWLRKGAIISDGLRKVLKTNK